MLRCRWGGAAAELCLDSCCLAGECIRVSVCLARLCVCAVSFLAGCHLCRNACSCMCVCASVSGWEALQHLCGLREAARSGAVV